MALAERLGVRGYQAKRTDSFQQFQIERVIDALHSSNRLLILDEAQSLSTACMTLIRDIHDTTGVPILLVATKELHDRILNTVDADRGQVYRRVDIVHHLTQGKDMYADGRPLFTVSEIKELYQEPPIRLSPDAAQYLQGVANHLGHGSLRRCKTLLRNAVRRASKRQDLDEHDKVTVTADDLEWVESHLRQEASEQETVIERRRDVAAASSA